MKTYRTQPPRKNRNAYKAWMYFLNTYCGKDIKDFYIAELSYDPTLKQWDALIGMKTVKEYSKLGSINFVQLNAYNIEGFEPNQVIDTQLEDEDIFS